jgi:dolichol-phosphate mannosyltransferase
MTRQENRDAAPWGRVLVIMPTFNESESLERVAGNLLEVVPGVDLLVVDDNSPDGTGEIADKLASGNRRVQVMHREGRGGLGRAYVAGFDWAIGHGYEIVVEMDADGSHPADRLPAMLDTLIANPRVGLVIGSRWVRGGSVVNWPKRREFLSRAANAYARIALGVPARDITAGYRAYPTSVLRQLSTRVDSRGYSFQIEMTLHVFDAGFPIVEVPIEFREREAGVSKMNSSIVFEAMSRVTRWGIVRRFAPGHVERVVESVHLS